MRRRAQACTNCAAVACAAAGKHVVCEKPLAVDQAAARRMAAACRDAGVTLPAGANLHSWSDGYYYGDHSRPEIMWDAPQRLGTVYPSAGYEISAAGYGSVEAALEGWKSSPGHNNVILNQDVWVNSDWNAIGIGVEQDSSVGRYSGNIYHVWFGTSVDPAGAPSLEDPVTPTTPTTPDSFDLVTVDEVLKGNPAEVLDELRDFDGNDLGAAGDWKYLGTADIQNDLDTEILMVNPALGRWATLGPNSSGLIDLDDYGAGGETRVVGIYLDPLVEAGVVQKGSDLDSARRFANDLKLDNLEFIQGSDADYDGDGLQQMYFRTADGTAYLHALMHADGNIRYANYQSEDQMIDYLASNGYEASYWGDWLTA